MDKGMIRGLRKAGSCFKSPFVTPWGLPPIRR